MNRRVFFAIFAAACTIPTISKMRQRIRENDMRAVLRLRDELSVKIKETNAQIKMIARAKSQEVF